MTTQTPVAPKQLVQFEIRGIVHKAYLTDRQIAAISADFGMTEMIEFKTISPERAGYNLLIEDETLDKIQAKLTRYGFSPKVPSLVLDLTAAELIGILKAFVSLSYPEVEKLLVGEPILSNDTALTVTVVDDTNSVAIGASVESLPSTESLMNRYEAGMGFGAAPGLVKGDAIAS
jgi:hypothetical protein